MAKKNLFEILTESENLQNTEVALAIESMSKDLDSMITKLSTMLTKDLANLVRKIKFDNKIEVADDLSKNIGGKILNAQQQLSQLKSDLETESVNMMNGNVTPAEDEENDFVKEFNADEAEEEPEETEEVEDEEVDTAPAENMDDFSEMERELKK